MKFQPKFHCCLNTFSMVAIVLVYVIAWLGVKFGINFMSCSENGSKIARGEAECNLLPFSLQRVKFIPNFTPSHAITC